MAEMKLVFLDERSEATGKTEKLITQVVERLARAVPAGGPADFAAVQVVLPTAEAGRILREELALKCDARGGVMNLSVSMPERLLRTGSCAPEAAVLTAWLNALRKADNRDFPTLLANDVLDKFRNSPETLLGWAESFQRFRRELALEDLDLAAAVDELNERCRSRDIEDHFRRFRELLELEKLYLAELKKLCPILSDPAAELKRAAEDPAVPPGVRKIVAIDCPDLKNGPAYWLERAAAKGVEIEFWITAPEKHRSRFDKFGRPEPELAAELTVELDLEKQVRCVPRPDRQAQKLLDLLQGAATLPAAVAVPDPEVAEALELRADLAAGQAPDRGGAPRFFVPRMIPLDRMPWTRIFLALAALATDQSVAAAARLWEEPFFADYARKTLEIKEFTGALKLLDQLREANFAGDTVFLAELTKKEQIRKYNESSCDDLEKLCRKTAEIREELAGSKDLAGKAFELTGRIGRVKRLDQLEMRRHENEIAVLAKLVAEVGSLNGIPEKDLPALLRRLAAASNVPLRDKPRPDEVGSAASEPVDVVGFLEIGCSRDDTVLMAGFNEEVLSNGAAVDPLLPEQLREVLGMTTRGRRFAADALRFAALAASRDLYILYGKKSQSGETLRPSRLLFLCGNDELPKRVNALFGDTPLIEERQEDPLERRKFEVRDCTFDEFRMSITGFKTYLECPFTFALQRIRRTESRDPEAVEMDNLRYGTVFHEVLEKLMRNYLGKRAEEVIGGDRPEVVAEKIEKLAQTKLHSYEDDCFGGLNRLPGLARLQCEIIETALEYFAREQAAAFAAGWRVIALERKVDVNWGELFELIFPGEKTEDWRAGIRLTGQIDRIDRRDDADGRVHLRVLDYKTAAAGEAPLKAHTVTKVPGGEETFRIIPGMVNRQHHQCYWQDLQLPLYVLLTRHVLLDELEIAGDPPPDIGAGYFDLPSELTKTRIEMFGELATPGILDSAARCADEILRRICVEKLFWPPRAKHYQLFENCALDIGNFEMPNEKEVR